MRHEEYYEEEVFEEEYYEQEYDEERNYRSTYERHWLDSSYYEDFRFL